MADRIATLYPVVADSDPDAAADQVEAAVSAALQVMLGDVTLEVVRDEVDRAHTAYVRARAAATGAAIAAAEAGLPTVEIVARLGLVVSPTLSTGT